jgi:NRPS condensation-like uncharacterized protein
MRFNAEIFDQLQFLFEVYKFNDHQLHCVIRFGNKINEDIMKKAIVLMLNVVPILGCVYVEDKAKPYWKSVDASKYENVMTIVNTEVEFNDFITSKTNEFTGPQMKACLLRSNNDSLAVIMNHMVCDATDFKKYLYLLSDLYSKLALNIDYLPDYRLNGIRGLKRINDQFRLKDKLKAFVLQNRESNKSSHYKFPMSGGKDIRPFILTHKISQNRYFEIREYCKKYNVTINDVVLAAYYRVIYNILNIKQNTLSIPIMVDMRRYLQNRNINSICNLTSTVNTNIDLKVNDNFNDTVLKVNKAMELKKSNFLGLNGFIKISLVFEIFNYKIIKKLIKTGFKNPLIGMTNIGILDSNKLLFQGALINDVFICGSIKYPPYFQIALSSYNDSITFSVNLYGNSKDKENIEHFFTLLDRELSLI